REHSGVGHRNGGRISAAASESWPSDRYRGNPTRVPPHSTGVTARHSRLKICATGEIDWLNFEGIRPMGRQRRGNANPPRTEQGRQAADGFVKAVRIAQSAVEQAELFAARPAWLGAQI